MRDLSNFYGFPVKKDYRFAVGGRRCRVGANGLRTLKCLSLIYDEYCSRSDSTWMISARPLVRKIQTYNSCAVLIHVVDQTRHPVLKILAIWLRGRCRGSTGTSSLAKYVGHPDFHTRKEATRALRKMSAWNLLDVIASSDSNERIRRMATSRPRQPLPMLIADVTRNFTSVPLIVSKKELYLSPKLDIQVKPPKSASFIRAVLERIRRLVAGSMKRS